VRCEFWVLSILPKCVTWILFREIGEKVVKLRAERERFRRIAQLREQEFVASTKRIESCSLVGRGAAGESIIKSESGGGGIKKERKKPREGGRTLFFYLFFQVDANFLQKKIRADHIFGAGWRQTGHSAAYYG